MPNRVNNVTVVELIEGCFRLSMSAAVPEEQRRELLALGKRLRGSLVNLLSARFEAGTPEVAAANEALDSANAALREAAADLGEVATLIRDVGEVVGLLDGLLAKATSFV